MRTILTLEDVVFRCELMYQLYSKNPKASEKIKYSSHINGFLEMCVILKEITEDEYNKIREYYNYKFNGRIMREYLLGFNTNLIKLQINELKHNKL